MADYTALMTNTEMGSCFMIHLSADDVATARRMIQEPDVLITNPHYGGSVENPLPGNEHPFSLTALFNGHIAPEFVGEYSFFNVKPYDDFIGGLTWTPVTEDEVSQHPRYSGVEVDDTIPY